MTGAITMGTKKVEPLYSLNQAQLVAIREACKEKMCPIPDDVDLNKVMM